MGKPVQPPCADCSAIVDALNAATGKRYEVGSIVVGRLAHQRHKENGVPACLEVVADRVKAWQRDPKMREYLRPATLFAKLNFAKYLDDIRAVVPRLAKQPDRPATAIVGPLRAFPTVKAAVAWIGSVKGWPERDQPGIVSRARMMHSEAEMAAWLASHGAKLEEEFPPI